MKKKIMIAFSVVALTAFTACNSEGNYSSPTEGDSGTDTDIKADTTITHEPDTTTEHDMAL